MQTLCALGLRVSELKAITVESLASGEASIRNKGKLRAILIPDALAKKLRAYCRERAVTTGPVFVTRTGKTLDRSKVWKMLKRFMAPCLSSASRKTGSTNSRKRTFLSPPADYVRRFFVDTPNRSKKPRKTPCFRAG